MKKRIAGYKFSRGQGSRVALMRSLLKALIERGSIQTTRAKAKFAQKKVDKLINLVRKNTLAAKRKAYAILGNDRKATTALLNMVETSFKERVGGYTRIINLPERRGDLAKMARLEWVEEVGKSTTSTKGKTSTKGTKGIASKKGRKKVVKKTEED